ncbi:MAG: copper resistance CopC family protein [Longimicrobiales bacterium]
MGFTRVVLLAGALAVATASAGVAAGLHTKLDKAVPEANGTTSESVSELHLIYNAPVQLFLSRVTISKDGEAIEGGKLEHLEGSEEQGLRLPLMTTLTPGTYKVDWQTASSDSHKITGDYTVTVTAVDK